MFWFDFKKTELPEEIREVEVFNSKLKELMDFDNYISRKDYISFFNRYEKAYNSLSAIKNAGLLKTYCKKNKISENLVNDFISNYNNLNDMISSRNKSFVLEKLNGCGKVGVSIYNIYNDYVEHLTPDNVFRKTSLVPLFIYLLSCIDKLTTWIYNKLVTRKI